MLRRAEGEQRGDVAGVLCDGGLGLGPLVELDRADVASASRAADHDSCEPPAGRRGQSCPQLAEAPFAATLASSISFRSPHPPPCRDTKVRPSDSSSALHSQAIMSTRQPTCSVRSRI